MRSILKFRLNFVSWKWFLRTVVIGLILGFGVHWFFKARLAAYKNELIQKGDTLASLRPPPCEGSEEVWRSFSKVPPVSIRNVEIPKPMKIIGEGVAKSAWKTPHLVRVPDVPLQPGPQQPPGMIRRGRSGSVVEPPPARFKDSWNDVDAYMNGINHQDLHGIAEALERRCIDGDFEYGQGDVTLNILAQVARLNRILQMVTLWHLRAGRNVEALKFHKAQINVLLAYRIQSEPRWSGWLATASAATTWELLRHENWKENELKEVQEHWEQYDVRQNLPLSLRMARNGNREYLFQPFSRSEFSAIYLGGGSGGIVTNLTYAADNLFRFLDSSYSAVGAALMQLVVHPAWIWFESDREEKIFLDNYTRLAESAERLAASESLMKLENLSLNNPPILSLFLGEAVHGNSIRNLAGTETYREMAIAALALRRYFLQTGIYPDQLSKLVPNFCSRVPFDCFTVIPLNYTTVDGGKSYRLYSVGPDMTDNGGKAHKTYGMSNYLSDEGYDWVWPRSATEEEIAVYEKARQ